MGNNYLVIAADRVRVTPDKATPNSRGFDSCIGIKMPKSLKDLKNRCCPTGFSESECV